jgi:uncharacterized protein
MRARFVGVAVLVVVLVSGCGASGPARTVGVTLEQGSATLVVHAEVAASPAERGEGLMGRRSLPAGTGMLFVFTGPVQAGFYMKDTLIPLDIAFISGDRVVEVRTMTPCEANPCPVTTPAFVYERALEVAAGTFERVGISAGAAVSFEGSIPEAS